jgi:hypothetical protein
MGGAIGPEKKLGIARGGGLQQCLAMGLSFQNGQAIKMRPNTPFKENIAAKQEMLGRDRCRDIVSG